MAEPAFTLRKKRRGDDYEVVIARHLAFPVWEILAQGEVCGEIIPTRTRDWEWTVVYSMPFLTGTRSCRREVNPPVYRPPDDFLRWVKLDILEVLVLLDKITEEEAGAAKRQLMDAMRVMAGEPEPEEQT